MTGSWAPLTCNFGGVWEIQPAALEERIAGGRADDIQVIDVREPAEFCDALGHLPGARLLPLSELETRSPEIDKWREEMARVYGLAEVIVAKQRHGSTGKVRLKFDSRITKFSDLVDEGYMPEFRG